LETTGSIATDLLTNLYVDKIGSNTNLAVPIRSVETIGGNTIFYTPNLSYET
jgi:hypothetical protein